MTERSSEQREVRRVSIAEAAEILGISKDAVRMRIRRGTLLSEKASDKVYVLMGPEEDADQDTVHFGVRSEPYRELIDELRDRVHSLEQANRENRRIIVALTQRIPETTIPRDQSPAQEAPKAPGITGEQDLQENARSAPGDAREPSGLPPEQEEGGSAETWSHTITPLAVIVVLAVVGVVVFVLSLFAG